MNNNPENDQLGLDNLEFFENFATEDPLEEKQFDPNANLAPDILAGEKLDLADDDLPLGGQDKTPEANPPTPTNTPDPADEEEEDEVPANDLEDDADDNSDDINYYEAFGKGLLRSGHFDLGEDVNPDEVEWTEESFLEMMSATVENKAWKQLEEIALEAYGQE